MITYYKIIGKKLNEIYGFEFENYNLSFRIEDVEVEPDDGYIDFTLSFEESTVYFRLNTNTDMLYIHIYDEIYEDADLLTLYRELYYNK